MYKVYYHPHLPLNRVLQAIVIPNGRSKIWESWKIAPWPNWESPRKAEFLKALLENIQVNGMKKPILLWDYAVVTGGTRLMCARALGKVNVPVIISLRDDLPVPEGARRINSISHPEIIGHNPDVVVWKKDQPLYLGYPKWDYLKPTGSECSSGVVTFRGKPPSSSKR